jgi:hypothetical protein
LKLLKSGSPTAISFEVALVILDAINGHARGWFPHVSKEIPEVPPPATNRDALRSVILEGFNLGILAAIEHVTPAVIGSTPATMAVFIVAC